jgi:hypothetical protein
MSNLMAIDLEAVAGVAIIGLYLVGLFSRPRQAGERL